MSKRLDGQGTIRQRADGRWEAMLTYLDANGARKRISFYGRTAEAALAKLDAGRDRAGRQEPVKDSVQRFSTYVDHWITAVLEPGDKKPTTIDQNRGLARNHVIPALGAKPIGQVLPSDITAMLARMKRAGLSDSTRKSVFLVTRVILSSAVVDGLIAVNPATKLTTPKVHREEAVYLTPDESRLLVANLDGLRYEAAVRLMLATGMRRGEVAGLDWADVDIANGSLRVRRTVGRVGGELVASTPKTEKSRRSIPLGSSTVEVLKSHRAAQAAERLKAGELWQDCGRVFVTEFGGPIEPRNLLRTVEIAARKAGITATAHALRHAAGSAMVAAGHSLPTVRDILGHSSVSITGDIYSHPTEAAARAAVDGWADQLGI